MKKNLFVFLVLTFMGLNQLSAQISMEVYPVNDSVVTKQLDQISEIVIPQVRTWAACNGGYFCMSIPVAGQEIEFWELERGWCFFHKIDMEKYQAIGRGKFLEKTQKLIRKK